MTSRVMRVPQTRSSAADATTRFIRVSFRPRERLRKRSMVSCGAVETGRARARRPVEGLSVVRGGGFGRMARSAEGDAGRVDCGLAFVGGVIGHQERVVIDQGHAGVTGVAAAGEGDQGLSGL